MYSELECGICCWTYNAGRRCPRELHCKHSFCESCLLALSRPLQGGPGEEVCPGAVRSIVCPLCRDTTIISGEMTVRAELRVDESVLELLLDAGVLDREDDLGQEEGPVRDSRDDFDRGTPPETPAEESDSSPGTRGGRVRRSWTKVWRKLSGRNSRRNCQPMTNDDLRDFAMMASYMF